MRNVLLVAAGIGLGAFGALSIAYLWMAREFTKDGW